MKRKPKRILLKTNILFTIYIIFVCVLTGFIIDANRGLYTQIGYYLCAFILFQYLYDINKHTEKSLPILKKEANEARYPIRILIFFICLILLIPISVGYLNYINKNAMNFAFTFTIYLNIATMISSYLLLLILIYLVIPAFVIPSIKEEQGGRKKRNKIIIFFVVAFAIFSLYGLGKEVIRKTTINNQQTFKCVKLPIMYQDKYLHLDKMSSYTKKKLKLIKPNIPLFYTKDEFTYNDYYEAKRFCASLNARIPNYMETYNIVFHRFDILGEKYYWTDNADEDAPLVLHFKNMSYDIVKKPTKSKPILFCVQDVDKSEIYKDYKFIQREMPVKQEKFKLNKSIIKMPKESITNTKDKQSNQIQYNTEKKHVNFSVKEVPQDIFNELIQKGYYYDASVKLRPEYETSDSILRQKIITNSDNIRLCYYPFTDYGNLNMEEEKQIWRQSFCSPRFDLIDNTPVLKSKHNKDSYCYEKGGRLPNLPELTGIINSVPINTNGLKYWINNKTDSNKSVIAEYKSSSFVKLTGISQDSQGEAYVFCIKNPKVKSKIISNYKSRFKYLDGKMYAKEACPDCYYYEVPDTVLQQ